MCKHQSLDNATYVVKGCWLVFDGGGEIWERGCCASSICLAKQFGIGWMAGGEVNGGCMCGRLTPCYCDAVFVGSHMNWFGSRLIHLWFIFFNLPSRLWWKSWQFLFIFTTEIYKGQLPWVSPHVLAIRRFLKIHKAALHFWHLCQIHTSSLLPEFIYQV